MQDSTTNHKDSLEPFIIRKVPVVDENTTVKKVLSLLERAGRRYDNVDYIYVNDRKKNLFGVFALHELFHHTKGTPVKRFMQLPLVSVPKETPLEKAAHLAHKYNIKQLPIVESGKLYGIVSSRRIISSVNSSLKEHIFTSAGVHKSHLKFDNSLEIPLLKVVKDRLGWLILGLIGAMLMAGFIDMFEEKLSHYLIIVSFIPAIVYISDALGTQLQTVFVRDIAMLGKELDPRRYISRQMWIATITSLVISILMFLSINLFWRESYVAFVIALAAYLSLMITGFTSLIVTWTIRQFKYDPALGSGPIATIISDMTSVVIYFLVVLWLL